MRLPPFSVFVVSENSMLPAYKPADHVVTFNWGKISAGDVIVFSKGTFYIKRVTMVQGDRVYVAGDNKRQSSKMFPVSTNVVVGKVIWKY